MATATMPEQRARNKFKKDLRPAITFDREAVLDEEHLVAAGVASSIEKVQELNLPCFLSGRDKKFIWGQVIDELAQRAKVVR